MASARALPSKFYSGQLDAVKALAILFVAAFHFFPVQLGWHMRVMPPGWFEQYWSGGADIWKFLMSYLYVGVNLFVIASGFGLYLSFMKSGKPLDLKEFFKKRVWRLMPAAILSIAVFFFVKGFFLDQWLTQNFYLNAFPFLGGLNLFSDNWFFPPINGETWFLGLIVQLYLFFPLLVRMYEKMGEKKFLILLFAVSAFFRVLYYAFWKDTVSSLSYGLSVGRLFEFGFGMVLAKKFVNGEKLSAWWILGLVGGLGYFWPLTFPFADSLLGVGFFTLVWFAVKKFPGWSWVGKVAAQSYLIFLLHHPFIWVLQEWIPHIIPQEWGFNGGWSLAGLVLFVLFFIFSYGVAKIAQLVLDGVSRFFKGFKLRADRAGGND